MYVYINIFFLRKLLYVMCVCDVYICVCGYIVFCLYMLNIYRKFYICKSYKFRKRRAGKKKIRKRKERRRGEEEEEK